MIHTNPLLFVIWLLPAVTSDSFSDKKIVPDILPNSPQQILEVDYEDSNVTAQLGNELTPQKVRFAPHMKWNSADSALYTLIMADPDVLPPARQFLNWLVVNIRGSNVSSGVEVATYLGASPAPGTGTHRYVFSVWQQNRTLTPNDYVIPGKTASNMSLVGRMGFNTADYAWKVMGGEHPTPVAGNFFLGSFDDYAKQLLSQIDSMIRN